MSRKNLFATVISLIILASITGYMIFWHILAMRLETRISRFYQMAAQENIIIEADMPAITGFPLAPEADFSGSVKTPLWQAQVNKAVVKGFPLPGQKIEITLADGFKIQGPALNYNALLDFNYGQVTFRIPYHFPAAVNNASLRQWRAEGGLFEIEKLNLETASLRLQGKAELSLDNELQPQGKINVRIAGYQAYLSKLRQHEILDDKEMFVLGGLLNGMARQDSETGERYVETSITLQNRKLLLGPLTVFSLPYLVWE